MNFLTELRIRRMAARDARHGYEANLDILGPAILGPKPRPPGEIEDGALLEDEGSEVRLDALTDEIESIERQRFELRPRFLYAGLAVLAFVIESGASFIVLESLGFDARERLILGISLAAATALVATMVAVAERFTRSNIGKWSLRLASATIFCALVAASAWLRATSGTDELSLVDLASMTLILVGATAAPAVGFHIAASGFSKANSLALRHRRALRERKGLQRRRARTRDKQVKTERVMAAWDAELARLRAVYLSRHRQVAAELAARREHGDERVVGGERRAARSK